MAKKMMKMMVSKTKEQYLVEVQEVKNHTLQNQ